MTPASMKQRSGETLRSYVTRFNVAATAVDKPDISIILMAAVSGVASNTDFKVALENDPPMDLTKFYHEAEENVKAEGVEINVVDDRGLSGVGNGKDKGKRRADDDFGE